MRPIVRRSLLTTLLVASAAVPLGTHVACAEGNLVSRTYDVSVLLTAPTREPVGRFGLPLLPPAEGPELWPEEEGEAFLERDVLVELVKACAAPAFDQVEGAAVEVQDASLQVTAPPEVVAKVERFLGDLWAQAGRRVAVEASWLDLGPDAVDALAKAGLLDRLAGGHLDAPAVAALREQALRPGSRASAASSVVRPGAWAFLRSSESVTYVGDYSVEIAQASRVGDPIMATADDGWSVGLRSFLLQDGGVWLEALAQRSEIERPIRTLGLEAEPFGSIDLPASHVGRVSTSGRLAAGETLATTLRSPERPEALRVLLLSAAADGPTPLPGDPRRVDLGALTTVPYEFRFRSAELGLEARMAPLLVRLDEDDATIVRASDLLERLRAQVQPEAWDREGSWISTHGHALYAHADPKALDAAARWLGEREAASLRTVRLRVDVATSEDGNAWKDVGGAALDVPLGRTVAFEAGVERAYVADWSVEVAQEVRCGDPVVGTAFGGIWTSVRATSTPAAAVFAVHTEGGVARLDRSFEIRRTRNEVTGLIETPGRGVTLESRDLVLEVGKPQVFESSAPGGGRLRIRYVLER